MTGSIQTIQDEIIDEFGLFNDWTDKYEYIIDMGKNLGSIDPGFKDDEHLIKGCQSKVWLHAELDPQGNVLFTADSDAIITRGIIAMLIRVLSEQAPEAIAAARLDFIDKVGLKEHLSPTRANGLSHMVDRMRLYGAEFMAKSGKS